MLSIQDIMTAVSKAVENALGASLSDILIQVAATFILVIIVKVFFWEKITDFLAKRKEMMDLEVESAKKANEEAQSLQEQTSKEYQDLREKSKEYLDKARHRGEEERETIVGKAREEAKSMLSQAEKEIEIKKKKAQGEIRKEAVDLAALMASKIIEKEIDNQNYQDLITDKIESSEKV